MHSSDHAFNGLRQAHDQRQRERQRMQEDLEVLERRQRLANLIFWFFHEPDEAKKEPQVKGRTNSCGDAAGTD